MIIHPITAWTGGHFLAKQETEISTIGHKLLNKIFSIDFIRAQPWGMIV